MGKRREGTVGRGMRIAADHRHARQSRALLWAHHMHDALAGVVDAKLLDAKGFAVIVKGLHLDQATPDP